MSVSPNDVTSRLVRLSEFLESATKELIVADDAAVRAKQRATVAYARAYLNAEGSVVTRQHLATVACETLQFDAEIAEAQVRAIKERLRTLHAQVDVVRSVGTGLRAEMALAGTS